MNSKISKMGAIVLTMILFGTAFFVPVSSVNVEQTIHNENTTTGLVNYDDELDSEAYNLDRHYTVDPEFPSNMNGDNDDAGHKDDAGDEIRRSVPIYPGEMVDNWPGRGNTGKLNADDDDEEDWFFFAASEGQEVEITMTPPSGFNYDLSLWDEDENQLAISTNSDSTPELLTHTTVYTGRFFMRIYYVSGSGEGQYSFEVTLNNQNDANTGNDAGDNFASATSISPGTYSGYLDMNDEEDWYKFNVNSGQGIYFTLDMKSHAYLSDFDIYLYNPSGNLEYYEAIYYDNELLYPADVSGEWRVKIDIFPGYTDIPQPTEWDYYTYGSGPYVLEFSLESSAPSPPGPIPQPDIIPVAHTFNIANSPGSNVDEYGYLASIPACNYREGGNRYLAPIVYNYDTTPTNWYGDVDDTTGYLLEDWDDYLASKGKNAVDYYVNSDPITAAAEIATAAWGSSDLAVVAIDGSVYEDTTTEILYKTATLPRNKDVQTIPGDSSDFVQLASNLYIIPMTLINDKWGAVTLEIDGSNEEPFLIGVYPQYMVMTTDWWPEHVEEKTDTYYPLTTTGLTPVWAAGVSSQSADWDLTITKIECDRYTVNVGDTDSVLTAKVTTTSPSDLLVFLVAPDGHLRAPDMPYWNGGPINPIHGWNGMDNPDIPPDCDDWRDWIVEPHTEFTAEVLHPEAGEWTVIVVPRYSTGSGIQYTLSVKNRVLNQKRVDASISAANAAVIASQEHVPLLYVTEDSVPTETENAFNELGVNKVIFVQRGSIGSGVESSLPTLEANLKTMQGIVDYIKDYSHTENYITITSLKTGEGFFAPAAMLAAYHCSPVLRIGEAPGNPAAMANKIDTWRMWAGDFYHGNRAPGHLPIHTEDFDPLNPNELLTEIIKFLAGQPVELPPVGQDAKRFWNAEMHDEIESYIQSFGLDEIDEQEAYAFVAPRKDIRLEAHSVMIGLNSYAGFIPGETPAYTSSIIVKNILYPALIYANPNRDVTTTQLMNFPDCGQWKTNDKVQHQVCSARVLKNVFMSHGRTYDPHCLWEAHLERMNDGVSAMYYSGHGTGGSGMSAQYIQTENCNYPDVEWPDAWRGYKYDNWKTARNNGQVWYNPEPANLYDIIHYKWHDQLFNNLRSAAIFYMSCSTGQQFGPMVYLDHGAVIWYGNAGSGLCPQADLLDDWFFEDALINGLSVGEAYSQYAWLHHRDFTIPESDEYHFEATMFGDSSTHDPSEGGITTVHCIYGDPELIIYSPEWTSPTPIDTVVEPNNRPPLPPDIDGPNSGSPGKQYDFTYVTTDPDGDKISYFVDWGDGDTEGWSDFVNSGVGDSASHTWSSKGVYKVKVRAKDEAGSIGPWGTLQINVPRSRARVSIFVQIMERVLKYFPVIEQILIRLLNL